MSSQKGVRERPEGDRTGRSGAPDRRLVVLQLLVGLAVTGFGWGTSLAGTEPFRGYWFDLVWGGFILAADAVVWSRAGRSLLHGGGWRLVAMFALSAPFWWAFEVANWRLENWRYVGTTVYGGQAHLVLKTISFLFVLPALAESRDLLRSFVRFPHPPAVPLPPWTATALLVLGLVCVPLLYLFPDQAYPLVWLAPLAVLDAVARLRGRPSIIGLVRRGRAGPVLLMAVAGLGTGILWEMWNFGAVPYWQYRIPYLGHLPVFEMPILGYLGYLPFILAADAFWRLFTGGPGGLTEGPVTALGREEDTGRRDRVTH
ncbi:MAG TPA: hypothetical protein VJ140_12700 [Actinomycetota bacterium]|nr:hypothetical protein [Actinomycetota bacterium]